jgi:hypothetical protein
MNKVHDEPGVLEWLLTQKQSAAIARPMQNNAVSGKIDLLYCKTGILKLSRSVPSGAVLSLFKLNGEMIYQTGLSDSTVKLPSSISSPVMLWRISHSAFLASGRVAGRK